MSWVKFGVCWPRARCWSLLLGKRVITHTHVCTGKPTNPFGHSHAGKSEANNHMQLTVGSVAAHITDGAWYMQVLVVVSLPKSLQRRYLALPLYHIGHWYRCEL